MKPFLYTCIVFILISCSSISTPCYMGVLPFAERERLNDSIILKLEGANQNITLITESISKINKDLQLSDSLIYPTEVRIYLEDEITNYSSLFRMYKNDGNRWKTEFYEHYDKIIGQAKLKIAHRKLKAKNDVELIFMNLIQSRILELPDFDKIQWKLQKIDKKRVELKVGDLESKPIYENTIVQIAILDGQSYTVQIKHKTKHKPHIFRYNNPESYLKHFPEVEELIYINKILDIIKSEFNIWNKL